MFLSLSLSVSLPLSVSPLSVCHYVNLCLSLSNYRLTESRSPPPSENFITVLTPAVYDYQYLPEVPVSRKTHVAFRVHAAADAHIALSHVYGDTDRRTYEIVLGGWNNTKSAIRYGGKGHVEVEQVGYKECTYLHGHILKN